MTFQGPAQHDALITYNYSRAFWFALYATHILLLKKRNDSLGNNLTQLLNICSKWAWPYLQPQGGGRRGNVCHEKIFKTNFWKCLTFIVQLYNCTIVARHPSYNVWTTAGASSMTVDSAATLVDCPTQLICTWICMESPPPAVFHDMTKFLGLPTQQYVS